jgi:hypothetical protein
MSGADFIAEPETNQSTLAPATGECGDMSPFCLTPRLRQKDAFYPSHVHGTVSETTTANRQVCPTVADMCIKLRPRQRNRK